jgi:hypothetical protein
VGRAKITAYLGTTATVEVDCTTLDVFVARNRISRIDLVQVDAEGGEYNFLKGARNTISKFEPLMALELNDELLKRSGASISATLSLPQELNYHCYRIRSSNDALVMPRTKINVLGERDDLWLEKMI